MMSFDQGSSLMFGLQKIDFFYIFRKYNILRVHCKNFRSQYEIFTKLQHLVESAPRLINLIKLIINYNNLFQIIIIHFLFWLFS